jgi:translation initiation factor IF-3
LSRPFPPRSSPSAGSFVRINGKIRAREVRVIGPDGQQIGIVALHEAINLARSRAMDLVEVAPNATPPVCRVVDYGKYRYEQAKKEKESKKHQHANRVKEIQLTATIDDHDFTVKVGHATDFLCEEMRVKISLRFRGREMAHQEFGQQVMDRFIKALAPFGQPVEEPKLVGRGLNVMLTPLPRNKRAKNPHQDSAAADKAIDGRGESGSARPMSGHGSVVQFPSADRSEAEGRGPGFANNPFADLGGQFEQRSGS